MPSPRKVKGEWREGLLAPNEAFRLSGGQDDDDGGWVGLIWNTDGRGKGGFRRGDVSSMTVVTVITMGVVIAACKRGLFPSEGGTVVDREAFSIFVSGDLTPCMDRSIVRDGGGGMNKGGGEFSWSGEGLVPVDLFVG
jgi:hypothetical protein